MLPNVAKTKQQNFALTDNGSSWKCKEKLSQMNGDISFLKKLLLSTTFVQISMFDWLRGWGIKDL